MTSRIQLVCAWLGLALIVGFFIGFVPLAGFVPPTHPGASAATIAAKFRGHHARILIGCFFMIVSLTLFIPWGAMIAARTWRMERGFPFYTCVQVISVAAATLIAVLVPVCWALAAYRSHLDPPVVRLLNDAAWYMFLYTWPVFSVWCIAIALPIFKAGEGEAVFPRWIAYFSLWVAVLIIPTGFMSFFLSGPLAYDGVIAFYIPTAVFFAWMLAMTYASISSIQAETDERVPGQPVDRPSGRVAGATA
jgi:hypothetical protein